MCVYRYVTAELLARALMCTAGTDVNIAQKGMFTQFVFPSGHELLLTTLKSEQKYNDDSLLTRCMINFLQDAETRLFPW